MILIQFAFDRHAAFHYCVFTRDGAGQIRPQDVQVARQCGRSSGGDQGMHTGATAEKDR